MPAKDTADRDAGLKRLGGGRWQTRDERFTIEPQSGTWAVIDSEQTDDLGLPLVRGPFRSLTAAKVAIAAARQGEAPSSPLRTKTPPTEATPDRAPDRETREPKADNGPHATDPPPERAEPRWFHDLERDDRRRAARLIDRLTEAGAADPEGIVRRDLIGEVPAVAAFAIVRAVRALGAAASAADVADLLTEGRDVGFGVRWRLVDDDGRAIQLDIDELRD